MVFPSSFTRGQAGIAINGLIWMGTAAFMRAQVRRRIEEGFRCIKLKVGGLDFELECGILRELRRTFSPQSLEIRLDANGAFSMGDALQKLALLSRFHVHSIEQPIKAGDEAHMAQLCAQTPLPIALDEELIGKHSSQGRAALLDQVRPQYIVLKPDLLGGFSACEDWICQAEERRIGWWVTSVLESNVGLNAIAQWTYTLHNPLPQGLGTDSLFHNNIVRALHMFCQAKKQSLNR